MPAGGTQPKKEANIVKLKCGNWRDCKKGAKGDEKAAQRCECQKKQMAAKVKELNKAVAEAKAEGKKGLTFLSERAYAKAREKGDADTAGWDEGGSERPNDTNSTDPCLAEQYEQGMLRKKQRKGKLIRVINPDHIPELLFGRGDTLKWMHESPNKSLGSQLKAARNKNKEPVEGFELDCGEHSVSSGET